MILFSGAKINRAGNEAIQSGVEPRPSFASRHHLFGFDETEFVSHSLFCSPPSAPFILTVKCGIGQSEHPVASSVMNRDKQKTVMTLDRSPVRSLSGTKAGRQAGRQVVDRTDGRTDE